MLQETKRVFSGHNICIKLTVNVNITFFLHEPFPQKTPLLMFEGLGQV